MILLLIAAGSLYADDTSRDETRRRIRVPILMYHYVSVPPPDADIYRLDLSVTPQQFAQHIAWLAQNGFTSISLDDLYRALTDGYPLPPKPVILTFDDGYADAYTNAFPVLQTVRHDGDVFRRDGMDRYAPAGLSDVGPGARRWRRRACRSRATRARTNI